MRILCSKFYLLFYSFILENSAYYSHETTNYSFTDCKEQSIIYVQARGVCKIKRCVTGLLGDRLTLNLLVLANLHTILEVIDLRL